MVYFQLKNKKQVQGSKNIVLIKMLREIRKFDASTLSS